MSFVHSQVAGRQTISNRDQSVSALPGRKPWHVRVFVRPRRLFLQNGGSLESRLLRWPRLQGPLPHHPACPYIQMGPPSSARFSKQKMKTRGYMNESRRSSSCATSLSVVMPQGVGEETKNSGSTRVRALEKTKKTIMHLKHRIFPALAS